MSRGPKNFEEAIEHVKDEAPAAVDATKTALGTLESEFRKIWSTLQGLSNEVTPGAERAKDETERRISESPWISIGIVGVVAFVLGYLFGNRNNT